MGILDQLLHEDLIVVMLKGHSGPPSSDKTFVLLRSITELKQKGDIVSQAEREVYDSLDDALPVENPFQTDFYAVCRIL